VAGVGHPTSDLGHRAGEARVQILSEEYVQAPPSWTEQAYHDLIYFNEAEKGGHFAAWEQPQLFSEELRGAFRTLR
jgi:hypothetical protein